MVNTASRRIDELGIALDKHVISTTNDDSDAN